MTNVINALDILTKYPHIEDYIKTYNNSGGFMFPTSLSKQELILYLEMSNLLDNPDHSGASFSCMLRCIQAVLNGVNTRENILIQIAKEKKLEKGIKYNPITKKLEFSSEEETIEEIELKK